MPKLKDTDEENVRDEQLSEIADRAKTEPVRVILDPSSPSIRSIIRIVVVALLLIFVGTYLESIINSLTKLFFLIILSIFFAYLVDPLVRLIRQPFKARGIDRFMPRSVAIGISYLVIFFVLGLAISYIAPRASIQAKEFVSNVPTYISNVRERLVDVNRRLDRLRIPEPIETRINDRSDRL